MPIANVLVDKSLEIGEANLTDFTSSWSTESGVSSEHMTVNFVPGVCQRGVGYHLMATLHLPSLWSEDRVEALQVGLARALADRFGIGSNRVHVMTIIIQSGHVVEEGQTQSW